MVFAGFFESFLRVVCGFLWFLKDVLRWCHLGENSSQVAESRSHLAESSSQVAESKSHVAVSRSHLAESTV
jgi:hypothetical protein